MTDFDLTNEERKAVIAVLRQARELADDRSVSFADAFRVLDGAIMRATAMLLRDEYRMREPHVVMPPRRG